MSPNRNDYAEPVSYGEMWRDFLPRTDAAVSLPGRSIVADGASTGATDNTAAINSTIMAVGIGGAVWIPAGTFDCEGPIVPLSGQLFDGPGTLRRRAGSTHDLVAGTGVASVRVKCGLDGGYAAGYGAGNSGGLAPTGHLVNLSGALRCRITGSLSNNQGTAVRLYDSSWCTVDSDMQHVMYGVAILSGGSAGDAGGGSAYNRVLGTMQYVGKNGVFISGHSDSTALPNDMIGNDVIGLVVFQPGDTAVELGQGSKFCTVTNLHADGNNLGYNGVLIRDAVGCVVAGFTIRNFPMFANGAATYLTEGNGIFFWPQFTGSITDCTVGPGVIENCSRGVFGQAQNTSAVDPTQPFGGGGIAGQVWGGNKITGVVIKGTQTGTVTGADPTALALHGFYIQSVSGFDLTNCVAHDCQNDGFRVGDTNQHSSYVTDVALTNCRAFNNGQQAVGGQLYYGFFSNGTSNQRRVRFTTCNGSDFQAVKTQHYGFGWNSTGASGQSDAAMMRDCDGTGNKTGLHNGSGAPTWNDGTLGVSAGNYTIASSDEIAIYTGTGGHTFTLPSASVVGTKRKITIRNQGSGALTIARNGTATLWLSSLAAGAEHTFVNDAANWY